MFLSRVFAVVWEGAVVESFQDSVIVGCGSQGVARASLDPVLCCMIPLGSLTLCQRHNPYQPNAESKGRPVGGGEYNKNIHVLKAHPIERRG